MSRDSLKIALVFSLAFNVAVIGAFAYGLACRKGCEGFGIALRCGPEDPLGGPCGRLARQIGMPRERALRFSRIVADSAEGMRDLRGGLQKARGELVMLIGVPEPDEKAIMAKVDEISAIQGQLEKRLVHRVLGASSTLRPEERERLMRVIRIQCGGCDNVVPECPKGAGKESEVGR
ncbi:MAG: periplasmic heavy metal sensor [Candidatus Krumholzibacteria bacterium]|nr:periplasmic heavy metal sensor [Candidatus Krumholzibacteria bacterium]